MEIAEIKNKIHHTINELPPQKLIAALDFLVDLQRSDKEETQTLLRVPGFVDDYRNAKEDIRTGNTVSWKDIKRDV